MNVSCVSCNKQKYHLSLLHMEGIYEPINTFPFDKMMLSSPTVTSGGNYFLKILVNNGPLYMQMPKSKTKDGIIQSGKRQYCDLLFTNENADLIQWMEDLENFACKYIYEHREKWFETEMELTDIENYFASPLKTYRSGKYYLARTNVPQRLGKIHLKIFDEAHNSVELSSVTNKTDLVSILEIQGIKCSARSFQFEFEIKQMMTLEVKDLFENCLLGTKKNLVASSNILEQSINETNETTNETKQDLEETIENTSLLKLDQPENESLLEETIQMEKNDSLEKKTIQNEALITSELEDFLKDSKEPVVIETTNEQQPLEELEFMEIEPDILSDGDVIHIKARNDVYYELYRDARKKAHIAKKMAFDAYLEANKIKKAYDLDSEDDDDWIGEMEGMEGMENLKEIA